MCDITIKNNCDYPIELNDMTVIEPKDKKQLVNTIYDGNNISGRQHDKG